jgi:hypothetical protein
MNLDQEIDSKLLEMFFKPCDINEHYPVIHYLASQCDSIVELGGVREFNTSMLLALAKPKKFTTVDSVEDVVNHENYGKLKDFCGRAGIEYDHITDDTRMVDIDSTDMLFTDSIHTADFVKSELLTHAQFVSKYIVIHDTSVYGDLGETGHFVNGGYHRVAGLRHGINEFLEIDSTWVKLYEYGHNNGLTILGKKS